MTTKNERRDAAREKARQERVRQQRREKRNRVALQVSVGVVIVAIVAIVAVVIVNSVRPPGPGPRNMADGGITIQGSGLTAVRTAAAAAGDVPTPQTSAAGGKVLIQAYEDFGCPNCREFEAQYGTQIKELITSGAAVVQYHPVAILDTHFPPDNDYSTRAANAAAAVANWSPDSYPAFHALLYESSVQPTENTNGLSDDRLVALAKQVKPANIAQIEKSIRDEQFKSWVEARTDEFSKDSGSLTGVDFAKRLATDGSAAGPGTPTVIVNGKYWDGTTSFSSFVTSVGGAYTPTPTPSASR